MAEQRSLYGADPFDEKVCNSCHRVAEAASHLYHFCAQSPDIYNPFSLLSAFFNGSVGSYWFETGTPSSLIRLLAAQGW